MLTYTPGAIPTNDPSPYRTSSWMKRSSIAGSCLLAALVCPAKQAPQPQMGAPASDISNIPRPIDDTMDRIRLRDIRKNPGAAQKTAEANDTCLLPPLNRVHSPVISATELRVPDKAKYEYFEGCVALSKKKTDSAEKHLRKAVDIYPKYPAAWVTLGQMLAAENHTAEARYACYQASTAEPNYVPAFLCLAEIAAWGKAWSDVLQFSARAIELDPVTTPIPYEYNADANLKINQLNAAEKSALRAAEIDTKNDDPRIHFLLAQIYEAKGDRKSEIDQLRQYLQFAKDLQNTAEIKEFLAQLEQPEQAAPATSQAATSEGAANLNPPAGKSQDAVGPEEKESDSGNPDLAESGADLAPGCDLDEVLPQIESKIRDFVDNVHRFTATQSTLHETISGAGKVVRTEREKFDYTVSIGELTTGMLQVKEYQNMQSSSETRPLDVVSSGLPALLLIFHPYYAGDFSMRCEAITSVNGQRAWQIHFRQRKDRPSRMRSYSVGTTGRAYPLDLEGRAWFMASNYQIVRLEAGLARAIPEIQLTMDHTIAEYGPVHFQSRGIDIWLPQTVDLISERKQKRFHEKITFSDYLLFAVDNKQLIAAPKNKEFTPQPFLKPQAL